jgi:hypothetical protein
MVLSVMTVILTRSESAERAADDCRPYGRRVEEASGAALQSGEG